jgi:uncharacterized protein YdhG (YjbR/CyaY superfamily)
MRSPPSQTVDEYLAAAPKDARAALQNLRAQINATAPGIEEIISYRIPTFRYQGRSLVAFSAHDNHCSLHLMSPALAAAIKDDLKAYKTTTATIRFTPDKPLPATLVAKLVQARIAENQAENDPAKAKDSQAKEEQK